MIIERVELKNYRQFKDARIEFAGSGKKNLTVIQGPNGAGKTNLLNAITWCLYGEEKHLGRVEEQYKGFPLVNTAVLEELEPRKQCDVEVKVVMHNKGGEKIIVERTQRFEKLEDGGAEEVWDQKFQVWRQEKRGDAKPVSNPEYVLGGLMPESIEEYFFFDGERLNEYFRSASRREHIYEAVLRISQIGLLENAIRHLAGVQRGFLKREKYLSPEAEGIKDELDDKTEKLEECKQWLDALHGQKKEAEEEEEKYSKKLRTTSVSNIGELEKERQTIMKDLADLDKGIKELERERANYLIEKTPSILAYSAIIEMEKLIEKGKRGGDIPPKFKGSFLKKLLKAGRCICGVDISKKGDRREKIENLLDEVSCISDIAEELIEESHNLRTLVDGLKGFLEKQASFGKKIKDLEKKRQSKSKRVKEIGEKIKGANSERIKTWESRLDDWRRTKDNITTEIGEHAGHLNQLKVDIDKWNEKLVEELNKEKKWKGLREKLKFCNEGLKVLEKIKDEIINDVRKEIEEKTKSQFLKLIWKKKVYKDVKIGDRYGMSVIDQYGREGLGTLSAGEREVLAWSFISALNSISGFDAPMIVDTPLARLSGTPRINFAATLLNYLKDKQITLLVTNQEYTPAVREELLGRIGKEYVIRFKETKQGGIAEAVPRSIR